jgi:hypothetical protein
MLRAIARRSISINFYKTHILSVSIQCLARPILHDGIALGFMKSGPEIERKEMLRTRSFGPDPPAIDDHARCEYPAFALRFNALAITVQRRECDALAPERRL